MGIEGGKDGVRGRGDTCLMLHEGGGARLV